MTIANKKNGKVNKNAGLKHSIKYVKYLKAVAIYWYVVTHGASENQ